MTRIASRPISRASRPARLTVALPSHSFAPAIRYGLAAAGLALGLAATAAPASAACTGTQLTIHRANATDYVCRANCAALPNELLLLVQDYPGHDATSCWALCDGRADCRAVSFEFYWEGSTRMTRCNLYREGELTTFDRVTSASPRERQPGVCYRRWAVYRDPRFQIDTNTLHQDQLRPGLPGHALPPKKP
jgi:hypothetical protein